MEGGGYVQCFGRCCSCGRHFGFNPHKVPSTRVRGAREPICRQCVEAANPIRKENGLPEIPILPGAYDPMPEGEL